MTMDVTAIWKLVLFSSRGISTLNMQIFSIMADTNMNGADATVPTTSPVDTCQNKKFLSCSHEVKLRHILFGMEEF